MAFFKALGALVIGYTGSVEYYRQINFSKPIEKDPFEPGSTDQTLLDGMNTGDVILFSRKWSNYHIPMAIAISAYKMYYNSEFDHCGVIVVHPANGVPYIIETNPFTGPTARRLDHRIIRSRSLAILLVKLDNFNTEHKFEPKCVAQELENSTNSEVVGIPKSILSSLIFPQKKYIGSCCTSANLVLRIYKSLGLNAFPQNPDDTIITCDTIYRRELEFNNRSHVKFKYNPENTYLRMS